MKLFYLANIRMPTEKAHGVQIAKMSEALAGQGIDLTLVLPKKFTPIKEDIYTYYQVKKNFKIVKIPSINLIAIDWLFGKLGFYLESLLFSLKVKILIIKHHPDIIYTREHILAWLLKNFQPKVFLENHVFSESRFYQKCLKNISGLIVITTKLKELHQPFCQNILVATDGVDLKQFTLNISQKEARDKLELPLDKKIVLYTGHLYKWKGAEVLAEAAQYLPENYQVYFVGGTKDDIIEFKSQVSPAMSDSEGSLKSQVKIIGHRPYQEMPIWLKAADVLVMTGNPEAAISQHYTSPMKLFEYMASQRPIVASNMPSFREVLNVSNAVLVKAGDAKALAEGIKKVGENQLLANQLSNQAYQNVQQYTWEKRAQNIKKFIINTN